MASIKYVLVHNNIFSLLKYMPLPESGLSQFTRAITKILKILVYMTVLKIDIPSLTDLGSHILISLKGPG